MFVAAPPGYRFQQKVGCHIEIPKNVKRLMAAVTIRMIKR